jgi:hypothetical protein
MPYSELYTLSCVSGFPAKVSGKIILSENLQPTTNVSCVAGDETTSKSKIEVGTHTDDIPLTLGSKHEQQFSEIVDQARYLMDVRKSCNNSNKTDLHPFRLPVPSNRLGSL